MLVRRGDVHLVEFPGIHRELGGFQFLRTVFEHAVGEGKF